MAVILFKKGTGVAQKFNEFGFEHSLENGWCLTVEEAFELEEQEVIEEPEQIEAAEVHVDITDGLTNKQIREMAKDAGIKNYKKARINKLKEALNDAQG
jgi:hypothetical protein